MIVNGRAIAGEVIETARARASTLATPPSFAAFAVRPSASTLSYLRIKQKQAERAGVRMEFHELPETATTEQVIEAVTSATEDAVIVQLPLPPHIDLMRVLDAIPEHKDADVLSPRARESGSIMHPVAASVENILKREGIQIEGASATVVGQGWLVGQPVAAWLRRAGATVTVVTRESDNLSTTVPTADILVSGAGKSGLITPDLVKAGAAVIDVGTSELGGSIAGDVDPRVKEKAGIFTPVPGGVGPIAVAYLLKNVVDVALKQRG